MPTATLRALVIEPHTLRQQALATAVRALGLECQCVPSAEKALETVASGPFTHIFCALLCTEQGGEPGPAPQSLIEQLRDRNEFFGLRVFLTGSEPDLIDFCPAAAEALLVWPISRQTLKEICSRTNEEIWQGHDDIALRQATRLRHLYEMSILGPELGRELDRATRHAAVGFQVEECVLWGPQDERHWPHSSQPISESHWPQVRERCEFALKAQIGVFMTLKPSEALADSDLVQDGPAVSLLAASIGPDGETPIAGICLLGGSEQLFSAEAVDSLGIAARRLSTELAWMSAHNRLLAQHKELQQRSLLDPMLGVWTRPALQEAMVREIASAKERDQHLAVVMLDYRQLRNINDRHGHKVGDAVLTHFAHLVQLGLRSQDMLGRVGGDELVALLVDSTLSEAEALATQIQQRIHDTCFEAGELSLHHVVQVGVTSIGPSELSGDAALVRAKMAIDAGKRERGSAVVMDTSSKPTHAAGAASLGSLLAAGSTLGGIYRIIHEISRGSMGVVYRGEDLGLGRPVAIKVLRSDLSSDKALVKKFRSEAALLASLHHRNVVQVYSFGTEGDAVYFVMELVEGEPLSNIVESLAAQGAYIDVDAVAKIVEEIAEALDAVHALGIVHRDVKPDNVLVDRINDRAVLVDVGIAKRQGDARDAAGTPGYAAPESFMEADESPATDVYGLAATAYAILTGSAPYKSDALAIMVGRQLTQAPPLPTKFRPDLSPAVDSVLSTALAPNPKKRYRSANAFSIALSRALAKQPVAASVAAAFPEAALTRVTTEVPLSRVSTYCVSPAGGADERSTIESGRSRGVIFRVARQFVEEKLGREWYLSMLEEEPLLGELLKPTLPSDSWQRTSRFLRLLQRMQQSDVCSPALFRRLGSQIATSTLAQLYGANPASQSPEALLKAAESYWSRYHTWGALTVRSTQAQIVTIELHNGPANESFCHVLSGKFAQIATLSGAIQADCQILECQARGDSACSFRVQWRESSHK